MRQVLASICLLIAFCSPAHRMAIGQKLALCSPLYRMANEQNAPKTKPKPAAPRPAPNFTLPDISGAAHSLASYRGHPITLFFFCGCSYCADCARAWAELQRGDALPRHAATDKQPSTVIVFSGSPEEARHLLDESGLDSKQTIALCDSDLHVTQTLYHAQPCPRVYVLDARQIVRYANNHADDAPQKASGTVIALHALDALRRCSAPPPKTPATAPKPPTPNAK